MRIGRQLILLFLFIYSLPVFGQQYKFLYHLDVNLNSVEQSKSVVTGKGYFENGYLRLDCFFNSTGQLFLSATFKDSSLGTLQGLFSTYFPNMQTESKGNYEDNAMQGLWQNWDVKGRKVDSVIYEKGVRIAYAKFDYYYRDTVLFSRTFTDSLKNIFTEKLFSSKGNLENEVFFVGNRGILITYDSVGVKTDSVFSRELKEASFPGGDRAWTTYLQQNLNPDAVADNKAPEGIYTAIIKFIVNEDGTIGDIQAEKDDGYGAGKEAIRVIQKSSKWIPPQKYGRYVKAYRRQPVTFSVSGQ